MERAWSAPEIDEGCTAKEMFQTAVNMLLDSAEALPDIATAKEKNQENQVLLEVGQATLATKIFKIWWMDIW
jgi:hypothetical protein